MEAEDPLIELADIHLPNVVGFWPPAPGWWLLAALLLATLGWLLLVQFRRWQQQRRLGMALAELAQVYRSFKQARDAGSDTNQAGLDFLFGINSVLKRVALVHFPQQDIAMLNGNAWLAFLDSSGNTSAFSKGAGNVLGDGEYRPGFSGDPEAVYLAARNWVQAQYVVKRKAQPALPTGQELAS